LGLVAKVTEASGGNFTDKISYEFMVLTDAGEDDILYCPSCEFCVNTEIANVSKGDKCPKCSDGSLEMARAAEVGNVFDLGQKFTKVFNVNFSNAAGEQAKPIMGCYGIGISRTMGVIVERHFDQRGIIWPVSVAPFQVHFITIGVDEQEGKAAYEKLQKAGISVLWDDRDKSPGIKFAEADLIGCPHRLVLSKKTAGQVEWKKRTDSESSLVSLDEFIHSLV
ncbi:MAG: His/Gly/Thr/Pro-type tRNA ligase C-terminal domain-containing protein, partial [Microgenomates group bacterium]